MEDVFDAPDASDEVTVNNERRSEKRRARADQQVVRKILNTREGRSWFYRRLQTCHIFGDNVDLGGPNTPSDALRTYFLLGQENIGKQMMVEAQNAATDLYLKMIEEAREEENSRSSRIAERNAVLSEPEILEQPDLPKPASLA